jgi:prepilin-type N-terminal cleavage/methylation domain-containing protein
MKNNGFTLIELLVVLAIISIIASITVPGFINYQQKSAEIATEAEMVNIMKTIKIYLTDNNNEMKARNINQLSKLMEKGGYWTIFPATDTWGTKYKFSYFQINNKKFSINYCYLQSAGLDRKFNTYEDDIYYYYYPGVSDGFIYTGKFKNY